MKRIFLFLSALFLQFTIFAQNTPAPTGLTTELLRAPDEAVITNPNPAFGWIFPQEGVKQIAWQILVASSPDKINQEQVDIWDSGIVKSLNSINNIYKGKQLKPNTSYWWKVKVWGDDNFESRYSKPQKFNTGNFVPADQTWPGESKWVKLESGEWVAEDRQKASYEKLQPVNFDKTGPQNWFADFGKAAFGTLELSVSAKNENDSLEIYLGERKTVNQQVHKNPGASNIGFYRTVLKLKKGEHNYQIEIPRHDARYPHSQKLPPFYPEVLPFRYAEAKGSKGVTIKTLTQLALLYYFDDEASSFDSPNQKLNQVWDLCKYTLKATPFLSVYCDGNRERMPYEGDSYIQQLGHYSVDREFSAACYTTAFLLSHASWPTEWQMHTVMMAREHYMHSGDTKFLEKHYEVLKNKTLIDLSHDNNLISTRTGKVTQKLLENIHLNRSLTDVVDWPGGERDGYVFTDFNTVVNAIHYYSLKCMAEIANALNKQEDREFFKNQSEKVRLSIMENFFDEERGIFVDGIGTDHASLHANMFPLAFNLVPEKHIKSVANFIKTKGMACSVYGAQYLLEALYNAGEAEYALGLMTSEGKRSWLNMLNVGSTMTTEAWDEEYKPNLTWNHAWATAPANIIPRRLMGIQPLEPGYKSFTINPQPTGLDFIELKVPTIRGEIVCNLETKNNEWNMQLSVPGNSEAFVLIPDELPSLKINGNTVQPDSQVHYLEMSRNLLRLKSGNYRISAKK